MEVMNALERDTYDYDKNKLLKSLNLARKELLHLGKGGNIW